jgi:ribonuclease HII
MKTKRHIQLKSSYTGDKNIVEIGLDEAGRGALAGPVTVAACIMPFDFEHPLVKDSKLLNEKQRKEARQVVLDNVLSYSIVHIYPEQIESTNILRATLQGMQECLNNVKYGESPGDFNFILVDGDQFHGFEGMPFKTIIGGDNKYTSIAAASILAKTERDAMMKELDIKTPGYGWNSNKGYGTKQHIDAIKEIGPNEIHRPSFISHLLTETGTLF